MNENGTGGVTKPHGGPRSAWLVLASLLSLCAVCEIATIHPGLRPAYSCLLRNKAALLPVASESWFEKMHLIRQVVLSSSWS